MKLSFKKRMARIVLGLAAAFIALFAFRFIYGYTTGMSEMQEEFFSDFLTDEGDVKRNYASDSYKFTRSKEAPVPEGAPQTVSQEFNVDQKYEKTAIIKSRTTKYEDDEKTARKKIKEYNAIIQYEQNSGGRGSRQIHLLIGIPPANFDTFYVAMLKIGMTSSKEVTKTDKTNEFKNLNAKKASLEITRQALLEIKKQHGNIDEFINLQNRILEIEQELQNLGVTLGDFDLENEFCTVRFSLRETREVQISLMHRLKVAFEWTIENYLLLLVIAGTGIIVAFFLLLIVDKVLPSIINKVNQ